MAVTAPGGRLAGDQAVPLGPGGGLILGTAWPIAPAPIAREQRNSQSR